MEQLTEGFLASEDVALKLHFPITSLTKTYKFVKAEKLETIPSNLFLKEHENIVFKKKIADAEVKLVLKGEKIPTPKQPKSTPEINSWMFNLHTKDDLKKKGTKFFVPHLPFDMMFYQTAFVSAEKNFSTQHILAKQAVELYCMKEDCFIEGKKHETYIIFHSKNMQKTLIIVFSFEGNYGITHLVKSTLDKYPERKFVIYTLTTDGNDGLDEFEEIKDIATIRPIPKEIYDTYTNVETESRNE